MHAWQLSAWLGGEATIAAIVARLGPQATQQAAPQLGAHAERFLSLQGAAGGAEARRLLEGFLSYMQQQTGTVLLRYSCL